MTSSDDDDAERLDDVSEADVREDLLRKIRTEGVTVAYETALSICRDSKAPAPAKATALTALFRVGGYFASSDDIEEKNPSEMTSSELDAAVRRLRKAAAAAREKISSDDIFG